MDRTASRQILALSGLYFLLFGALGAEVSFLPQVLATSGLSAPQVSVVLASGTVAQVLVAPVAGVIADRVGPRVVMSVAIAAAIASLLLLSAASGRVGVAMLLYLLFGMATAPLNPLADAIAVPACEDIGVAYGRVRGAGSAGFLTGILISSLIAARLGVESTILIAAVSFALLGALLPALPSMKQAARQRTRGAVRTLLSIRAYRRVLLVAAMVIGSHAMSDAFAVIHWQATGIGWQMIGIMLALAVVSELAVFIVVGPMLLDRLGPSACACIGALGGALRWAVLAESQSVWPVLVTQLLHGLSFSLVHLACMRALADVAPRHLFATAQSLYGVCSNAIASAIITLAAGAVFGAMHGHAFWLASTICLIALPFASRLNETAKA